MNCLLKSGDHKKKPKKPPQKNQNPQQQQQQQQQKEESDRLLSFSNNWKLIAQHVHFVDLQYYTIQRTHFTFMYIFLTIKPYVTMIKNRLNNKKQHEI